MKKAIVVGLLLCVFGSCTKDKCYIVLDAGHNELCSKCFHTVDERTIWIQANGTKTPEEQCK